MKKLINHEKVLLCAIPILLIIVWSTSRTGRNLEPKTIEIPDFQQAQSRRNSQPETIVEPNFKRVQSLSYSPDGKKLLVTDTSLARVYDAATQAKIYDLANTYSSGDKDYLGNLWPTWSEDGSRIVSLCGSRFAIWDAQTGALNAKYNYGRRGENGGNWDTLSLHPQFMRFSADDKRLISERSPAAIFDAAKGKRLQRLDVKLPKYELLYYNEELGLVAFMGERGRSFQVVDIKTNQVVYKRDNVGIQSMSWQKDVLCVVLQGTTNKVLLWDGKYRRLLEEPPVEFSLTPWDSYAALNDHTMVFSTLEPKWTKPTWFSRSRQAYWFHEVVAWNFRENRVLWRTETEHFVSNLQVSPNGKFISAVASEGSNSLGFVVFNADGKKRFEQASKAELYTWSPDNRHIAAYFQPESSNQADNQSRIEIFDVGE